MRRLAVLALACLALRLPDGCTAEPRLGAPLAGCFRDETDHLRYVLGVPGSFVLSAPIRSDVLSAACSEDLILVKTPGALERVGREGRVIRHWTAPGGPALFGFGPEPTSWLVYFPLTSEFYLALGDELCRLPLDLAARGEDLLAVALTGPDDLVAVVRRAATVQWLKVSLADGRVKESCDFTEAAGPVLVLWDGTVLWGAGEDLVVQKNSGAQRHISLPAPPTELGVMSEGWVRVKLSGGKGHLVLRLFEDRHVLFRLPEVAQ